MGRGQKVLVEGGLLVIKGNSVPRIALEKATVEFYVPTKGAGRFGRFVPGPSLGGALARKSARRVSLKALNAVSLTVEAGERLGVMGRNGSGKTTMLRVLGRVYRPSEGVAKVEGSVSTLGGLSLGINDDESGLENLYMRGALLGLSRKEINMRVDEVIAFSGLEDSIGFPLRTYSSGMQMRLSFAVSTLAAPDILVLDEWLAVGDEAFRRRAEHRLQAFVRQSRILVLASHSRTLLERTCTRGIILENGRITSDGPITEVTSRYFYG